MDGTIIIGTEVDTKGIENGVEDIKDEVAKEQILDFKTDKQSKGMTAILQLTKKIGKGFLNISSSVAKFLGGIVKVIAQLGLIGGLIGIVAIIGVGIANAFKEAIDKDEELKTKLEYLKFAFTSAFAGIGEALVKAVKWAIDAIISFMGYIGRFIYLLTGKNIFKKSGISDFEKSLNKSSKSAKELNKQLAGFDEINVLSDSSSGGGNGTSAKIDVPDLADFVEQETKVEKVTKKLIDKWFDLGQEMKATLDNPNLLKQAYGNFSTFIEGIIRMFYGLWDVITGAVEIVGGIMDIIVGIFKGDTELIKSGVKSLIDGLKKILSGLIQEIKGLIQIIWGLIVGLLKQIWDAIVEATKKSWNKIVDTFSPIVNFFAQLWDKIKNGLKSFGTKVGEVIGNAFKTAFNGIMKTIETFLNTPIKAINKLINVINKVPGINIGKLSEIKLPRLAKGGIVSQPGKGVMMGSYIAGEGQTPEAVIPLDDITMNRLGEAIASHMTINANMNNYMNGRLISREIQKIQNQTEFAVNR